MRPTERGRHVAAYIHPSLRSDARHRWEWRGRDGQQECRRCGWIWSPRVPGQEPPKWGCRGMRQTKLRAVSPRRREKRQRREVYGPLCDHVRGSPCLVCGKGSDPHHVRSVGAGHGDWLDRDGERVGNVVPLCREHHRELDSVGSGPVTFHRKYNLDLAVEAERIGRDFQNREAA